MACNEVEEIMNIKSLYNKYFGNVEKGTLCWLLSKEGNKIGMVPGMLTINDKDAVLIQYKWLDNTGHAVITHQDDYLCVNPTDGRMIYSHNVGDLFISTCRFDGQIGSEYFNSILESHIGTNMLRTLQDFQEESKIPWKTFLIIGGIIIGFILLWQTGIIEQLLNTVTNSIAPQPPPKVPVG